MVWILVLFCLSQKSFQPLFWVRYNCDNSWWQHCSCSALCRSSTRYKAVSQLELGHWLLPEIGLKQTPFQDIDPAGKRWWKFWLLQLSCVLSSHSDTLSTASWKAKAKINIHVNLDLINWSILYSRNIRPKNLLYMLEKISQKLYI